MSDQVEYAMTHIVGQGGLSQRYQRPESVLEMATRLQRWAMSTETCNSCVSGVAVRIRGGMPLCGRCHAQAVERRRMATVERTAMVTRADDADSAGAMLRGTAIVFNSKSEDLGGFIEVIRPSAAHRNEAEQIDVRALWSHDSAMPLGRMSAGTLRTRVVTRGVLAEIDPPRSAAPQIESVRRRDVTGMSFAFQAMEDDWSLSEGMPLREVTDMRFFEVSGVSFPAYEATTLRVGNGNARSTWCREADTAERLRLARL